MKFTLHYDNYHELAAKLKIIANRLGYVMTKADPVMVTMAELSRLVNRPVSTVSRSISRPSCPPVNARRGKKRILRIEPTEELISFLTNPPSRSCT